MSARGPYRGRVLDGPAFGARVVRKDVTGSTNDDALALAREGAEEGTVIVAKRQDAGRGREGRAWTSPEGGLWFSVILRPSAPRSRWGFLALLGGLAVAEALRDRGIRAGVKWPNDVEVAGRKVAGVLCESRPDEGVVLAGFGVNANVPEDAFEGVLRDVAGSLLAHGGPHDAARLMHDVLARLQKHYRGAFETGRVEDALAAYRDASVTLGRRVRPRHGPAGTAVAVLDTGALVVETASGDRVEVLADDVPVVREEE